ncbi:MAG TPA: tetratricopeptide repeat protein [Candidatus Angelobacter sp.]|nr:tetratricopeptide repeat protein [Candidatus Angelobacter sp.]
MLVPEKPRSAWPLWAAGGTVAFLLVVMAIAALVLSLRPRDPYATASKYKNAHDYSNAAIWFRKAAERGNANAQVNLALMYRNGQGVPQNPAEAFIWARKSADQGNAAGQTLLGILYESGEGVSRDEAAAADCYQRAAHQGYAWAESLLANMYLGGRGNLQRDYVLAYRWFLRAAAGGDETAKSALVMLPPLMNRDQIRRATELAQRD